MKILYGLSRLKSWEFSRILLISSINFGRAGPLDAMKISRQSLNTYEINRVGENEENVIASAFRIFFSKENARLLSQFEIVV